MSDPLGRVIPRHLKLWGAVVTEIKCGTARCNRTVGTIRLDTSTGRIVLAVASAAWRRVIINRNRQSRRGWSAPDTFDIWDIREVPAGVEAHCRQHGWSTVPALEPASTRRRSRVVRTIVHSVS